MNTDYMQYGCQSTSQSACAHCGYDMCGAAGCQCPECGFYNDPPASNATAQSPASRLGLVLGALVACAVVYAVLVHALACKQVQLMKEDALAVFGIAVLVPSIITYVALFVLGIASMLSRRRRKVCVSILVMQWLHCVLLLLYL